MNIDHLDTQFKKVQPAVIALFKNLDHLEETLGDLKKASFKNEDISLLTVKKKDFDSNIVEGVATGAIAGAIGGIILCVLVSLRIIAMPGMPGASTFITVGPFISAVAGLALGVNVGCLVGAVVGFFVAEIEAHNLAKYIKDRGIIVAVHATDPSEQLTAKKILVEHEAIRIYDPLENKTSTGESQRKHFGTKLSEA